MSDSEDQVDFVDEGGDDLFGDGGDDDVEIQSEAGGRVLSDRELASDHEGEDHYGRNDEDEDMADPAQTREELIASVVAHRHKTPKSKDGQVQSLRVPKFLKIHAEEYKPDTFEPSEQDMRNAQSENPKSVIRWQRDPATGELKSNAQIYRWSDGSVTLAVGNEHFDVAKKDMVPPKNKPYEERQDAHYYAAAASLRSNLLMTVGHVSEQYTVKVNKGLQDEALVNFANAMAAAARGKRAEGDMIITTTKDPELQKKEAELAEKERLRAQRRRDNAAARIDSRSAGGRSGGGGLSSGMLEGRSAGGARKRGPGGAKPKKRRNPEYDSDDEQPLGNWRHNEYDEEDDFIAPSDEEGGSGIEDDEEEEDILDDDDDEDDAPRKKKRKAAKADDDDDADGDDDFDDRAPARESKGRRRHVIDDDDDDE